MQKQTILGVLALGALGLVATQAKETPQSSPDDQAIRRSIMDYCDAYNDGKIDALLSHWAKDADYVNQDGQVYRGKDAIGALLKSANENLKGYKLNLKIDNLRLVKSDVAIEDGVATLAGPEGETNVNRYTAVWIKEGDHWLINSARDLPAEDKPAPAANADYLQPLAWLVGDWKSDDKGPVVSLSARWTLDKNYLVQDYTVTGEAADNFHVMQVVGFDPLSGQIKSWTFDSRGGYGEGLWQRDDNTWSSKSRGVLPDGRVGNAVNSLRFIDDAHLEWRSTGRNVEGQPMPDVQVNFVRSGDAAKDSQR